MPTYIKSWDETKPAGTRALSLGDDDIREFKYAIRERLAQDHQFAADETGDTTIGYHKKITFSEVQAADPSNVANIGFLYLKDVSAKVELFWMDEDGDVVQLTAGGYINGAVLTFAADFDFGSHKITAEQIESDVATGTAPLIVASTTKVDNLNADKLDGINSNETELKPFGAWASKSDNTVYEALTDGLVVAYAVQTDITGYTDGSNPPTTIVQRDGDSGTNCNGALCMPVKKGDYWKVVGSGARWWVPMGV